MSEHQPIDLDDLRRVGVWVREKTDDNWLADMVEIACDEIARLREERRWVPVGERLPKDNDLVLTVGKGGWIVIGEMTKSCGWQSIHCDNETGEPWISDPGDVTHWMPLPPGPEGDG